MSTSTREGTLGTEVVGEIRDRLVSYASSGHTVSYSELVRGLASATLTPDDARLYRVLEEISIAENAAGRGMLSVLVVHKNGDRRPGPGFFELARRLGRNVGSATSREETWIVETNKVFAAWKRR